MGETELLLCSRFSFQFHASFVSSSSLNNPHWFILRVFIIHFLLFSGFYQMASKPSSWGLWGPIAEVATEARIENLERKMDEVERLLKGKHRTQARWRSPLR